jgi:hypothetical protein
MSAANQPSGEFPAQPGDGPQDEPRQSPVNAQAIDAVNETMASLLASAPGAVRAALDQVAAQCAGLSMLNAVQAQQNAAMIANAAVAQAAGRILRSRPRHVPREPEASRP